MKRVLVMVMSVWLVTGAIGSADAKKPAKVERTVEGRYEAYPSPVTGCNDVFGPWACLTVQARSTERFITAKVTDKHGQPVFVEVWQGSRRVVFCGETTEPFAIEPGAEITFHVGLNNWPRPDALGAQCPTNRVKSTGTIRVTLSNVR